MPVTLRTDADRSYRVAGAVGILGAVGIAFDHVTMPAAPSEVALGAIGVCLAVLLWIVLTRQRARLWRGNLGFLIVQVAVLTYLWVDQQQIAESGLVWVPFRANQLGAFTVALLAPPRLWVGVVAIVGFAGTAVVQFLLFDPGVRQHLAYGDPWATIAFGSFAIAILIYRLRARAIEHEAARAHAEAEATQRTARAILALRDLACTPLQTLVGAVELMKHRGDTNRELVERVERATNRIADLEELVRPFQDSLEWHRGDEAWDPREAVREAVPRDVRR